MNKYLYRTSVLFSLFFAFFLQTVYSDVAGIYRGSFDPLHVGHEEVIDYCLTQEKFDKIYILATEPNAFKPFRTPDQFRLDMLRLRYGVNKQIILSTQSKDDLIARLRQEEPELSLVCIAGSDVHHIYHPLDPEDQSKAAQFDSYLILIRDGDENLQWPSTWRGKPIKIADKSFFHLQGYSSTQIRRFLGQHPELYAEGADLSKITFDELPLSEEIKTYILQNKLYFKTKTEAALGDLLDQIKANTGELLGKNPQFLGDAKPPYTFTLAKDQGNGGLSGDCVALIKDGSGEVVLVVKAFITERKDERFKNQVEGIQLVEKLGLADVAPIHCLAALKGENFHLMIITAAPGEVQEMLMKRLHQLDNVPEEKEALIQKMKEAFHLAGKVHAELHAIRQDPVSAIDQNTIERYTSIRLEFKERVQHLQSLLPKIDLAALDAKLEAIQQAFYANPGMHCYVHGDPHPGNWFYDSGTKKLTLIDLGGLTESYDETGNPKGYPAEEFWRGQSCIAHLSVRHGVDPRSSRRLQKSFREGYQEQAGINYTTPEADRYFHTFWELINMRDALQAIEEKKFPVEFEPKLIQYVEEMTIFIQNDRRDDYY